MGQLLSALTMILFVAVLLYGVFLYFLPTILAGKRKHANRNPIIVINIFLGWTLLGWVAALAWSVANQSTSENVDKQRISESDRVALWRIGTGGAVATLIFFSLLYAQPESTPKRSYGYSSSAPAPKKEILGSLGSVEKTERSKMALAACVDAIKLNIGNISKININKENSAPGDDFYFAWYANDLIVAKSSGRSESVTAYCSGSLFECKITNFGVGGVQKPLPPTFSCEWQTAR